MSGLDPRTKSLIVVASSVALFAPGGGRFVPAVMLFGLALALGDRAYRRAVAIALAVAVLGATWLLLPRSAPSVASGLVAVIAGFLLRFAVLAGVVAHLVSTTDAGDFSAAMRAARLPGVIVVPTTVMLRFIPVVIAEIRAVWDAMRIRGLAGAGMLARPVTAIEHLVVPAIGSSLRIADDLTASGLLRGLSARREPTVLTPLRLRLRDYLWSSAVIGALATCLVMPGLGS